MAARGGVKIRWNMAGFREIRTSERVLRELDERAQRIAEDAGAGFEAQTPEITGGRGRGRVAVVTTTIDAALDQARNHTLERALGAGRG